MENKNIDTVDIIINRLSKMKFLKDNFGNTYILLNVNGHSELMNLQSEEFKSWLTRESRNMFNKAIGTYKLKLVTENIKAKARIDGEIINPDLRIAGDTEFVYYDLANESGQVIEISKNGWLILDCSPKLFKRFNHQVAQVIPDGKCNMDDIFNFINVKKEDRLMFLIYLISCFIPQIAHPIGIFYGEKGAAKTTALKILKSIIDPSILETMAFPKNNEELIQQLSHHWYCNFDNISSLNPIISDTLCRAVTGEGYTKRCLFTVDNDVIYTYKRCISLNGIALVAKNEDILDRSIIFELERISVYNRMEEVEIWKKFNIIKPKLLKEIFDTISIAIRRYETVKLDKLYRLADYTRWGYCICEALGYKGELFLEQYEKFIQKQNEEVIQVNPFANAVMIFADEVGKWEGSALELLERLEAVAKKNRLDIESTEFPKTPSMVTRKLKQIQSNLEDMGINFSSHRRSAGSVIKIKVLSKECTEYSPF